MSTNCKEYIRDYMHKYRAVRIANNQCIQCGMPSQKTLCPQCMKAQGITNNKSRRKNPEKFQATQQKWRKKNPEKWRTILKISQMKRRGNKGECSDEQLRARIEYYGGCCYICGEPYEEIDHVIPVNKNGSNWPANLRPACRKHNRMKHNKTLREFYRYAPEEFVIPTYRQMYR